MEHFKPKYVYALPPMYNWPYDLFGRGVSGLIRGNTEDVPGCSFFGTNVPGFNGNEEGRANFTAPDDGS